MLSNARCHEPSGLTLDTNWSPAENWFIRLPPNEDRVLQ